MVVYILYSNWMHNGDNAVNEVIGVYDCLPKAQQALADCINNDLQYHSFEQVWCDSERPFEAFRIDELATMFHDDPLFIFDIRSVRLWNGDEGMCCEDYQYYNIEERDVL